MEFWENCDIAQELDKENCKEKFGIFEKEIVMI